jgi:hypothetical protein
MHFGNRSSRRSVNDAACSSELQAATESTRTPAVRYGLNAKTVAKRRKCATTADRPMGPGKPKSTVLIEIEEAIVVEFRPPHLAPAR